MYHWITANFSVCNWNKVSMTSPKLGAKAWTINYIPLKIMWCAHISVISWLCVSSNHIKGFCMYLEQNLNDLFKVRCNCNENKCNRIIILFKIDPAFLKVHCIAVQWTPHNLWHESQDGNIDYLSHNRNVSQDTTTSCLPLPITPQPGPRPFHGPDNCFVYWSVGSGTFKLCDKECDWLT